MSSDVFAIASAKGGVGKTTTTINLAAALADRGEQVLAVEMDLAMANMVDFLDIGIEPDQHPTLHDILAGHAQATEGITPGPHGLDVLPSGTTVDGFATTDPSKLEGLLTTLRPAYDYILIDTGAGLSYESIAPLTVADGVILVSTPRLAAVRDTRKTKDVVDRAGGRTAGIVFVKSGTGSAPEPSRIAEVFEIELLGHVPDDPAVPASQDVGRPVAAYDAETAAARAYEAIADRFVRVVANDFSETGFRFTQPDQGSRGPIHEQN